MNQVLCGFVVISILSGCVALTPYPNTNDSQIGVKNNQKIFGDWVVTIEIDDFEEEVLPTLTAQVLSLEGRKIGTMSIGYFVDHGATFNSALVSFRIAGLDPTFPACDYEFLKYKIDSSESKYFPTRGYACPSLEVDAEMATKFSLGETFRFKASGKTGIVSLKGFADAWEYTIAKRKQ